MLARLKQGEKYTFGSAQVLDEGIILSRKKFFGADEQIRCRWNEVTIASTAGGFFIYKTEDKKLFVHLEYLASENCMILEVIVRAYMKKGGGRLSILLQ